MLKFSACSVFYFIPSSFCFSLFVFFICFLVYFNLFFMCTQGRGCANARLPTPVTPEHGELLHQVRVLCDHGRWRRSRWRRWIQRGSQREQVRFVVHIIYISYFIVYMYILSCFCNDFILIATSFPCTTQLINHSFIYFCTVLEKKKKTPYWLE